MYMARNCCVLFVNARTFMDGTSPAQIPCAHCNVTAESLYPLPVHVSMVKSFRACIWTEILITSELFHGLFDDGGWSGRSDEEGKEYDVPNV